MPSLILVLENFYDHLFTALRILFVSVIQLNLVKNLSQQYWPLVILPQGQRNLSKFVTGSAKRGLIVSVLNFVVKIFVVYQNY